MKKANPLFVLSLSIPMFLASCDGLLNKINSDGDDGGSKSSILEAKGSDKSLADEATGDIEEYESTNLDAVEQSRPTIMVIPGDITLQEFGCLKRKTVNGISYTERNYTKYVQVDDRCRRITSFIQDKFNDQNYPLNDFEQTLKSLENQRATDMADNIQQDAKTQLLLAAQPDIILEMEYKKSSDLMSHDYKTKNVSYTLSAIDAYTNKVVATITASNLKGSSTTQAIQGNLGKQIPSLMKNIEKYYSDILKRGRDITVRVNVESGCNIKLTDQSVEGDTYSDWIIDYMKTHTVKGAYKMTRNTNDELFFQNCRIKLLNEDGTQYGVYDFTRDLQKNLRTNLGLSSVNRAQGLGEVVLTVKGL